eukprot:CAMPEP_0203812104 /NCGR_PEP_ID=MMETSP0115-20131106/3950_1 /ASSEMBLY_ACC=CAM_ASM_000227 /TAXON_ID=33651 /ORGANISM="Bicosoecid sp, Strain ms1" /LENGTH=176 /DNA_ID=CAMNT_0050720941 /DNA_START=41 /DNA_END=570 /DNA_ORIENTATION=+
MADGGEDVKPAVGTISLKVRDQAGTETVFKVKPSTKFEKIFKAYAGRKGVEVNSLRFTFDGERIEPHHTPVDLEMEDGDQVDAIMTQLGGGAQLSVTHARRRNRASEQRAGKRQRRARVVAVATCRGAGQVACQCGAYGVVCADSDRVAQRCARGRFVAVASSLTCRAELYYRNCL